MASLARGCHQPAQPTPASRKQAAATRKDPCRSVLPRRRLRTAIRNTTNAAKACIDHKTKLRRRPHSVGPVAAFEAFFGRTMVTLARVICPFHEAASTASSVLGILG